MATRMLQRRGTTAQWTAANPVLGAGEIGFDTTTGDFKIGDGSNRWLDLDYFLDSSGINGSLEDYVPLSAVGFSIAELVDGKVPSEQLPDIGELSQDAVNQALTAGTGITKSYDDEANTLTLAVDTNTIATKSYVDQTETDAVTAANSYTDAEIAAIPVLDVSGKQDKVTGVSDTEIGYLDGVTSAIQTQLDAKLNLAGGTMTGNLTLAGAPTQANHAATKAYADSISEGLHIHQSVVALAASNISLPTAPATLDGVTLTLNDRVLLTGQTNPAENGIYVVINGDLARAADYNTAVEIQAGDFVFVSEGTTYNSTSWVQENEVTTLGTDPIVWSQFAGIGTITAGNGIIVTGSEVSVDFDDVAAKTHTHLAADISNLGTGVATFLTTPTSANLRAAVTDETGSGNLVFSSNPSLTGVVSVTGTNASMSLTGAGANITIGRLDGTATTPYIDFNSGSTVVDYDSRIIATGGNGTIGGGTLQVITNSLSLPTGTSIGAVSSTELQFLDGVTSSVQTQLNGKANTSHTHAISDVTGLQTALDGKQSVPTSQSVSTNITAVANAKYFVNTSAARTITLPASPALGDEIQIFDASGTAGTNIITVQNNGNRINGVIDTALLDVNGVAAVFVWTGSTYGWRMG